MKRTWQTGSKVPLALAVVLAVLAPATAQAYREKILHGFGNIGDGAFPQGNVIMDAMGNLYGTAQNGGGSGCGGGGCGIVFKISPKRKETVLHAFGNDAGDGYSPLAGATLDNSGNLLGVTTKGGAGDYRRCDCGAVYQISTH